MRPGYRPPEDVEVYKNRTAEAWRTRGGGGVPGATAAGDNDKGTSTAASNKNAKRKAARKKAKEKEGKTDGGEDAREGEEEEVKAPAEELKKSPQASTTTSSRAASPRPKLEQTQEEKERLAKAIRKKIRQANDLKDRKEGGESLLPEQLEKVIKLSELTRQLNALGFE